MDQTIYSIGHGTRAIEDFIALLLIYKIEFLIDVRTTPYSRFNPQYNQKALTTVLEEQKVRYVFMGDTLGGRPKDPASYSADGKIDYEILQTRDYFKEGINRLQTAYLKEKRVALMCSERKPQDCHRSKLIGKVLLNSNINILHIDELGEIKNQLQLEKEFPKEFMTGI